VISPAELWHQDSDKWHITHQLAALKLERSSGGQRAFQAGIEVEAMRTVTSLQTRSQAVRQ